MRAAFAIAAVVAMLGGQSSTPQAPIVRGIDHFFATSSDPEPLYKVFRDTLGLPEVYPFRVYEGFTSGVVSMGNVLFEVVTWSVPAGEVLPTEFKGIAFEPSERLPVTLERLTERELAHEKPEEVMMTNAAGKRALAYVNIGINGPGGLPPASVAIFINDNLGSPRASASREDGARELERRGGGPLGIVSVRELVIGVEDPAAAVARWRLVAGTGGTRDGVVTFAAGPDARFVRASTPGIVEMVVVVRSLAEASRFLESRGSLRRDTSGVFVDPAMVGGLRIRLVERD